VLVSQSSQQASRSSWFPIGLLSVVSSSFLAVSVTCCLFEQQEFHATSEESITMQQHQRNQPRRDEHDDTSSTSTNPHARQNQVYSWQPIHLIALIIMSVLAVIALIGGFLTKEMQPFLTIFSFLSGAVAGIFSGYFGH
jgi:hypothetical protein